MKKLFLVILMIMFVISFVIAERYENNNFRYGIIDIKGDLITTSDSINNVDVIGFVCSSENCSSVSGKLWDGNILNSINDFIQLVYPTDLISEFGYAIYMFKDKYIPYEVNADWWGTSTSDPLGPFDNYLSKKEMCVAEIENFKVTSDSDVDVSLDVNSPIEHTGPLEYVPPEIESYYTVNVDVNLEVTKNSLSYYTNSKTLSIPYSGSEHVDFSFPVAGPGTYKIYTYTSTNDKKCINYTIDKETKIIFIGECQDDSGCSSDYYSDNYCQGDDVYHDLHDFSCVDNECQESIIPELHQDCGTDSCGPWQGNYCKGKDVYHNRTCYDRGCSSGSCFSNLNKEEQFVETCADVCIAGHCEDIACYNNSDCGSEICLGANNYCSGGNVYNNYTYSLCNNAGTLSSYCSQESFSQIIAYCVFDCEDARCISS